MAESTRLCPNCKEIMKPCSYKVGKPDGSERLEHKLYTPNGVGIIGKLLYCSKCGTVAVVSI